MPVPVQKLVKGRYRWRQLLQLGKPEVPHDSGRAVKSAQIRIVQNYRHVVTDWLAGRPIKELPLRMAGPALLTVRRWLQRLTCHQVQAWLEQRAQTTPSLVMKHLGRRAWTLAQGITKATKSHAMPAALIQWAKLRHLLRYGSSTYSQI